MMETRILHFADLHLSEFGTYAGAIRYTKGGTNLKLMDTVAAVRDVLAQARNVDGVVIAGDLYDRARPTPNEELTAQALLSDMSAACGRPVLLIPGNHDMPRGTSDASAVAPLARVHNTLVVEEYDTVDYAGVNFGCLPYPRRGALRAMLAQAGQDVSDLDEIGSLSQLLGNLARTLIARGADVLLGHVTVAGAVSGVQPRPIDGDVTLDREIVREFKAAMLGHIHKPQDLYPGAPIVCDFGEADGLPRGARLWTRKGSGEWSHEQIVARGRSWRSITLPEDEGLVDIEEGDVVRVRGVLPMDEVERIRVWIGSLAGDGVYAQDELEPERSDRVRDAEIAEHLDDDAAVLGRALDSREITQDARAEAMRMHGEEIEVTP